MPEAFKLHFNSNIVNSMAKHIAGASNALGSDFNQPSFVHQATTNLNALELKARSNQIMTALLEHMPPDFALSAKVINKALAPPSDDDILQSQSHEAGLAGWMMMPITDYVTAKALEHGDKYIDEALLLLHACTQRFSAEFSIRPFLRDYPEQTLATLHSWATDDNVHVRRLVSEGSRPFLPWGLRLHNVANNPAIVLPLLELLKDDSSEYVRRSVANNLNDIAKVNPNLVIDAARRWWDVENKNITRLIRHGCRTLIKDGNPDILALLGFGKPVLSNVVVTLAHETVAMGDEQTITLAFANNSNNSQNLLIDYAMHHQKSNGKMSPKVFKWTSLVLAPHSKKLLCKQHSFKFVTTRKYYSGEHKIEILINGQSVTEVSFELTK